MCGWFCNPVYWQGFVSEKGCNVFTVVSAMNPTLPLLFRYRIRLDDAKIIAGDQLLHLRRRCTDSSVNVYFTSCCRHIKTCSSQSGMWKNILPFRVAINELIRWAETNFIKPHVPGLRVILGQYCPRVATGPSLPNGPLTQLSPYLTRKPGTCILADLCTTCFHKAQHSCPARCAYLMQLL